MNWTNLTDIPEKLKVLMVSKGRTISEIQAILKAQPQIIRIGENRLESAEKTWLNLPKNIEKHFIGKLQTRKIKKIAQFFDVVESLENQKQAEALNTARKNMRIYLQVNLSGSPQRQGCSWHDAPTLADFIQSKTQLQLEGVMGIASQNPEKAREEFRKLKQLQIELGLAECSMGMSDDFEIAIEEGATLIRLGRSLFKE